METKSNKTHRNREEMSTLIETWKKSGASQHKFCEEHNIPYSIFQYWLRKFKKQTDQSQSGFVELKPVSAVFPTSLEIIFPSGAKVVLSGKADAAFIRSLVF